MYATKKVHIGGINCGKERIHDTIKKNRKELIYDLNCGLFDYLYANHLTIKQLPPLDDWVRSTDKPDYWSYTFPEEQLTVWLYTEIIELN